MVQPANGNREAIADFPSHRPRFGKFDVVGVRWRPTADETGLRGHELKVFAVALAHRFADDGDGLFAGLDLQWLVTTSIHLL